MRLGVGAALRVALERGVVEHERLEALGKVGKGYALALAGMYRASCACRERCAPRFRHRGTVARGYQRGYSLLVWQLE